MKKLSYLILLLFLSTVLPAQNFFREKFDNGKKYILLANPTAGNIETINFLVNQGLLKVDLRKVHFVGVYFEHQNYDFKKSKKYIHEQELTHFDLHEFRGDLSKNKLFANNSLTEELKYVFRNSAGIFFFGGPDIPPGVYNEKNSLSVVTDPERHYFETTFLFHLLGSFHNEKFTPFLQENPDYFITGFCLGMQTMNVATGGTLIQDIPAEVYGAVTDKATLETPKENLHRNYWQNISDDTQLMGINFHPIRFTTHPFFTKRVKAGKDSSPLVLSSHHQAAEKLGKGMLVTAVSSDGKIVEALAHDTYPHVFAVQFHPEVPALYENQEKRKFHPDDAPQTYHQIIGKKGLKFHKKYWKYISKALKKAGK
ncbi:putative glutamine amidotransferase [Mariniphaga anaerophila]|uniref:Putative glutamine amidotransferase n=1 Tax=Mariniphaga anaerophila TaxID=1484053 RepID=A0A1M5G7E4_9BACT|nr:gamma-glutamyl-gamma-aminobutyrate hydrolase family protein [Mariniphaga anaerophila]SHF99381.1 putative glutamine amidotransferase [Mariniphaga anaerophila]